MMSGNPLFRSEDVDGVLVVTPLRDMGEFELAELDEPAYDTLVELTNGRNVVIDLSETDYFGSSTIGLFIRFAKHVHSSDRRVVFCNLSPHEEEVIGITHVNQLLEITDSRQAAMDLITMPVTTPTKKK